MRVIAVFFARDEGCHRRRTVFCQSPSVISAHTPGAHGASRATDLCVPLVADSASNFAGSAIVPGPTWSLQVDTLLCLCWTCMVWPLLFPLFGRCTGQCQERRWTGVALTWLIPLIALGNGVTPYLGLKTVANYSMFSNLRTEGGQTNHLLIPAGQFFLAEYQTDLVRVVFLD